MQAWQTVLGQINGVSLWSYNCQYTNQLIVLSKVKMPDTESGIFFFI